MDEPLSSLHTEEKTCAFDVCTDISDSIENECVYLSMIWHSGYLGAAYYDADTAIMHFLLETMEIPPFNLAQRLVYELKPVAVITSAKQDTGFLNVLRSLQRLKNSTALSNSTSLEESNCNSNSSSESTSEQFLLEMLSSVEFDYQSGRQRILLVETPGMPRDYSKMERSMFLSSRVPFDNVATIRAAGALLRYLEKKRIGVMLENPGVSSPILNFQLFSCKDNLLVDKVSYKSLQIFQSVSHPSAYKASTREGLSLFGVLNRTITCHGHKLLKTWFFRPTLDRNTLQSRLDAVSFFVNARNEDIVNSIKESLKHIKNVTKIIAKIKTSKLNVSDWVNVLQTTQNALRIADICHGALNGNAAPPIPDVFKKIVKNFADDLSGIAYMITNYMDVTASKQEGRFVVMPGISEVIDDMKKVYAQLPSLLDKVAQQEIENFDNYLSWCQIVYMRRIGYLLFVSREAISKMTESSLRIPGMIFVASTDDTVFYKTPATEKLDEEYGDILESIAYHEMEVMNQLQNAMFEHSTVFCDVMKYTAELDCLISFAIVAKSYNYVKPLFSEVNEIHVIGSRHPLQEHVVSLFVPNDIHFSSQDGLIKILTGPNASGKSVYLRQIGLIVFMACIGSFVPAASACIGRVSSLYSIIRSPESLSCQLSTFANDLNRMSLAIQGANEESIVLIDEFGKGTATLDGVSLLASCLTYFIGTEKPPMVCCTTHFHSMTQQNMLPVSDRIKYQKMDTVTDIACDTAYLYQLVDGVSKHSHASAVARTAGIPFEIIERGQEISKIMERNAPIYKFDKSSALTYQLRCNEAAAYAAQYDFSEISQLKQLLTEIRSILRENSSRETSTDDSTIDQT